MLFRSYESIMAFAMLCVPHKSTALVSSEDSRLPEREKVLNNSQEGTSPEARRRVVEDFGKPPLYFIENRGQQDERVLFYEKGAGRPVFFTREEAVFALGKGEKSAVLRLLA